jgi:dienelactone hydrolase
VEESGRRRIEIKSSADGSFQPSYLTVPDRSSSDATERPLAILLHTWSNDLEQRFPEIEGEISSRGWLLLQPNFRGRNDRPQACGSTLAQQDILDAVDWVRSHFPVDDRRIYLFGESGGGHMTLLMAARYPERWTAASAWVGISDLTTWYEAHQADTYGEMMRGCFGGSPVESDGSAREALARSPITYLKPGLALPIDIAAGRSDSIVSVEQSLRAFNAIVPNAISEQEIRQLLGSGPGLTMPTVADTAIDPTFGRRIFLRRTAGLSRLTVFEGGHEWLAGSIMAWLEAQNKH